MQKFFFLLIAPVFLFIFSSCDDSGSSESRAKIIAEDFVREQLLTPDDAEFDNSGVEKTGKDSYHVTFLIKTKNGFGMVVPRKVSVRLSYRGDGDWTSEENWILHKISLLDEATGRVDVVYDSKNDNTDYEEINTEPSKEEHPELYEGVKDARYKKITLAGQDFTVLEGIEGGEVFRLYSEILFTDDSEIKAIYADMKKKGITMIQLYNSLNAPKEDYYASIINGRFLDKVNNRMINLDK
jgi:hypothetical protein